MNTFCRTSNWLGARNLNSEPQSCGTILLCIDRRSRMLYTALDLKRAAENRISTSFDIYCSNFTIFQLFTVVTCDIPVSDQLIHSESQASDAYFLYR